VAKNFRAKRAGLVQERGGERGKEWKLCCATRHGARLNCTFSVSAYRTGTENSVNARHAARSSRLSIIADAVAGDARAHINAGGLSFIFKTVADDGGAGWSHVREGKSAEIRKVTYLMKYVPRTRARARVEYPRR